MLEEKINELRKELVEYGALVEKMIEKSIRGLLEKNRESSEDVMDNDEPKANEFEIRLDERCIAMIAQYEPKARDLRTIIMVLKMNNDLERMGDHGVNICENAMYLISHPRVKPLIDIPRMADTAMAMVRDSINSLLARMLSLQGPYANGTVLSTVSWTRYSES